jgi:hypothetical protein
MKRDEYLADEHVSGFTRWASQLVTGDLGLTHRWTSGRGTDFECTTLYGAFEQYRWPDNSNALDWRATAGRLQEFRANFEDIGVIDSGEKQEKFVDNAEAIVRWGGTPLPRGLDDWRRMTPEELDGVVQDIRAKLDPVTADTDDLSVFPYMGSGFSKVYSILIDGFPIYDSRVACALNCLVEIYRRRHEVRPRPEFLKLRMPPRQEPKTRRYHRCDRPEMNNDSAAYARDNLKAAWLLQGMVREPGKFGQVEGFASVDALQHALFMVGYAYLPDSTVPAA